MTSFPAAPALPHHLSPWRCLPRENTAIGEHAAHWLRDLRQLLRLPPTTFSILPGALEAALMDGLSGPPWPLASCWSQPTQGELGGQVGEQARLFLPGTPLPRGPQLQVGGLVLQLEVSWVLETTPPAAPQVLASQQLSTTACPGGLRGRFLATLNLPPCKQPLQ